MGSCAAKTAHMTHSLFVWFFIGNWTAELVVLVHTKWYGAQAKKTFASTVV